MATDVTFLSWNVFNENPDAERIVDCLGAHKADVALLQEATLGHLEAVRGLYPFIETATDYLLNGEPCYLAIASRYPLKDVNRVAHFSVGKRAPTWLGRKMGWTEFLESLSAEIEPTSGLRLKTVVAHTSAAIGPSARMTETEAVFDAHCATDGPCVVAADFNSLAKPWNAPLLALPLEYRVRDFSIDERARLDGWFASRRFKAAARGVTYPRFLAQLDQIYVRDAEIIRSAILRERYGSDHRPMLAELRVG